MNGYWKFHRKLIENELFFDDKAYRLFTWILSLVGYKTGKMTVGRLWAAKNLRMTPSSFYRALKRLEKSYGTISLKSNNKMTEISVLNWDKYQSDEKSRTTSEQQVNNKRTHTKEGKKVRKKEYINNIIIADEQQLPENGIKKEITVYERKELDKQTQLHRIVYFLEDTLDTKIVNWGKQAKALNMLIKAGYSEPQIIKTISYMATKDDFFSEKGFDLMAVANNISRYKAQARKVVNGINHVVG